MKNVLVTGGAGFIGSNFVHFLLKVDPKVQIVNLDALTYAGSLENLRDLPDPSRHNFIEGNIADKALVTQIFEEFYIDTVVHFAAETHVDRSILAPGVFVETNVIGTFTLLEAARKAWIVEKQIPLESVRFHHVSTDEVLGHLQNMKRHLKKKHHMHQDLLMLLQKLQVTTLYALIIQPMGCLSVSPTVQTIMAPVNFQRN